MFQDGFNHSIPIGQRRRLTANRRIASAPARPLSCHRTPLCRGAHDTALRISRQESAPSVAPKFNWTEEVTTASSRSSRIFRRNDGFSTPAGFVFGRGGVLISPGVPYNAPPCLSAYCLQPKQEDAAFRQRPFFPHPASAACYRQSSGNCFLATLNELTKKEGFVASE